MPSRKRRLCWTGTACTANWASAMASTMLVVAFTFSGSVNSCVHKTMGVPKSRSWSVLQAAGESVMVTMAMTAAYPCSHQTYKLQSHCGAGVLWALA